MVGFNFVFVVKFGFDTSQRSCQVRQAVDFASASAAKSLRLPRSRHIMCRARESFAPTTLRVYDASCGRPQNFKDIFLTGWFFITLLTLL
jgi:hypothetical protein